MSVHPELRKYIENLDLEKFVPPPDTFYWIPASAWHKAEGEVTHVIALVRRPSEKRMLICIDLFNIHVIAVLLPYDGTDDSTLSYAVDIIKGTNIDANIVERVFAENNWQATHKLGDTSLYKITNDNLGHIIQSFLHRSRVEDANQFVVHLKEEKGGEPSSQDLADAIIKLSQETVLNWQKTSPTVEGAAMDIQRLAFLITHFAEKMTGFDHLAFAVRVQAAYRALMDRAPKNTTS